MNNVSEPKPDNLVHKISIVWSIDDVLNVRPDLNKEQASLVLTNLKNFHDASIGINWDVIAIVSDDLFSQHLSHIQGIQYKGHEIVIVRDESDKRYMADIRVDDYDGHIMKGFCGLETESEAVSVAQAFVDGLHYTEEE